jgi:hypothetical protein
MVFSNLAFCSANQLPEQLKPKPKWKLGITDPRMANSVLIRRFQMFPNSTQDNRNSAFMTAVNPLCIILAIGFTVFASPKFYFFTKAAVARWLLENYGFEWLDLLMVAWALFGAGIIFFATKLTLTSLAMLGAVSIARRFL